MRVENAVYPSGEQLTETVTKGSNTPIVMLNLLKFKDQAKYKDGTVDGSDVEGHPRPYPLHEAGKCIGVGKVECGVFEGLPGWHISAR